MKKKMNHRGHREIIMSKKKKTLRAQREKNVLG